MVPAMLWSGGLTMPSMLRSGGLAVPFIIQIGGPGGACLSSLAVEALAVSTSHVSEWRPAVPTLLHSGKQMWFSLFGDCKLEKYLFQGISKS